MDNQNLPQSPNETQEQKYVREFLEIQKLESSNKQKELELRQAEIQSNERIAMKSIEAQQADYEHHGKVFLSSYKARLWLFALIAFCLTLIILAAIQFNKPEIALELIKIGGAVLLGYFAGVNKGKADAAEKQKRKANE